MYVSFVRVVIQVDSTSRGDERWSQFPLPIVEVVFRCKVRDRRLCRRVDVTRLLTGVGSRLAVLFVVAEKINVVLDVRWAEIGNLEIRSPDGLWIAGDVFYARQVAKVTPLGHLVPGHRLWVLFRVLLAGYQPTNVIPATHTFRHYFFQEVARNQKSRVTLALCPPPAMRSIKYRPVSGN